MGSCQNGDEFADKAVDRFRFLELECHLVIARLTATPIASTVVKGGTIPCREPPAFSLLSL